MSTCDTSPLSYSLVELAHLTSLSRRTLERAIVRGELRSRKIGARRIILIADARRWLSRDQPSPAAPVVVR